MLESFQIEYFMKHKSVRSAAKNEFNAHFKSSILKS